MEGDGKRGGAEPIWNCLVGPCAGGLSSSAGWEGCLRERPESAGSTVTLCGELLQLGHIVDVDSPLEKGCWGSGLVRGRIVVGLGPGDDASKRQIYWE